MSVLCSEHYVICRWENHNFATSDAVDEVVDGHDLEPLFQKFDDAVWADVTAAAGDQDGLAAARHHALVRFLEFQFKIALKVFN